MGECPVVFKHGRIDGDAHELSVQLRQQIIEKKQLGFRRPGRQRPARVIPDEVERFFGSRSRSIATVKICDLTDEEYAIIERKLLLLPEHRRIAIPRTHKGSLKNVLGQKLAYELMKAVPDSGVIECESERVIPDTMLNAIARAHESDGDTSE